MKKLYEEENIRAIAEQIRSLSNISDTYTVAGMSAGIRRVYENAYSEGENKIMNGMGIAEFTSNGKYYASNYDLTGFREVIVDVPTNEGGITPSGEIEITENGTYDVTEFASAKVNVPAEIPEGLYDEQGAWQMVVNERGCSYLFYQYGKLTSVPQIDTSKVTDMSYMFSLCTSLTTIPLLDTNSVTNITGMFNGCTSLPTIPLLDTSRVTSMGYIFYGCNVLTNVPEIDTSKVTNMSFAFYQCKELTNLPSLDMRSVTSATNIVYGCKKLTNIAFRNIKSNFDIGGGQTTGLPFTVESLINTIYELIKQASQKTLTIKSPNLAKLANVYVKLVEITDEMRAEDDLIDVKYPFVVCESTDEGAMLITDYASDIKNWTIA